MTPLSYAVHRIDFWVPIVTLNLHMCKSLQVFIESFVAPALLVFTLHATHGREERQLDKGTFIPPVC